MQDIKLQTATKVHIIQLKCNIDALQLVYFALQYHVLQPMFTLQLNFTATELKSQTECDWCHFYANLQKSKALQTQDVQLHTVLKKQYIHCMHTVHSVVHIIYNSK